MIQRRASLDERSVQAVARGEVGIPRRRRARGSSKSSPVQHSHMLDGLSPTLQAALTESGVDLRCVQVVNACTAVIWNHPAPWPGSESEPTQPSDDERQNHRE